MGVPVDLDQILPAKKQKKLVLYSTDSSSSSASAAKRPSAYQSTHANSPSPSRPGSRSGEGGAGAGASGSGSTATSPSRRRRPPPPDLDFTAVRQLYSMTEEALNGLTDGELREHVAALNEVMYTASKVLEYWLQRKDRQLDEKEAFEGVIENLVKHARQVRK
ncbi:hypothetical protein KEM56_001220 [Ascosphaera pollenicola]|nr:hypothetical protein KEM56_001220 [Ascosphaera pollenicola]